MARKKVKQINGLGNKDKLTVQKCEPLISLYRSELTLAEFKILDIYLSRIDSHKPEKRQVVLSKGEVESALELNKINAKDLKERLKHLMGNVVELQDSSYKKGIHFVTLFEEAIAEQDGKSGLWQVRLECTQKAMKYFFNVDNIGYLRYKLRSVVPLNSRYSYVMFLYLESNRHMHLNWVVDLDELKHILKCEDEETYQEYKRFNDRLLKRVQKELVEKTELRYTYEPVKKGRSVVAIRFTLEPLQREIADPNYDPNQLTLDDVLLVSDEQDADGNREKICAGFEDKIFEEFTDEQLKLLKELAWSKKSASDVSRFKADTNDIFYACEMATSEYLKKSIQTAKIYKPKNLFNYVKQMIENSTEEK